MRVVVFSDIHANVIALQRVLEEVDRLQPDAIWCLGDTVGYGPYPQECVDIIRERADVCLAGNHDLAVLDKIDLNDFNPVAREAALWQRHHLDVGAMAWLDSLPSRTEVAGVTLAHASPRHPVWEYVDDEYVAAENYDAFDTQLCLVGHSHRAVGWRMNRMHDRIEVEGLLAAEDVALMLARADKWLLNPGSVGQPRDHDPRASFAILDTEAHTWAWRRVEYDIETMEKAVAPTRMAKTIAVVLTVSREASLSIA
jgi:diadenosine tetraphosphatase ApaH/serine/threonine PP2A family protein phosphatase